MKKITLWLALSIFLAGCGSTRIRVIDYSTQEPIRDALVYAAKSHYPFAENTYTSYKTDEYGSVVLDYTPTDVFAAKMGYWHARETVKNVILLVPIDMSPAVISFYGDIFICLKRYLSQTDPFYADWLRYMEFERASMQDYIKKYAPIRHPTPKTLSPIFEDIRSHQRLRLLEKNKINE
ncbi:MAG: hypothetical protein IJI37_06245 [Opitutales bacterium]|nr:hypothetical protein [Opitutales bacterium]